MTEHKRRPISIDHHGSSLIINPAKRHKSTQITLSTKERKEKVGERIVALQQLVSPFGKTDTASVLTEAMEYIKFLQDQVKVLSAPYLQSTIQSITAYEAEDFALCQYRALSELLVAMEQIYGLQSRSTALQRSNLGSSDYIDSLISCHQKSIEKVLTQHGRRSRRHRISSTKYNNHLGKASLMLYSFSSIGLEAKLKLALPLILSCWFQ